MDGLTPAEEALIDTDPARRAEFLIGGADLLTFVETHLRVPIPAHVTIHIPVRGDDPAEREADVAITAVWLGVPAKYDDQGCLHAERQFGPWTLEKHTNPAAIITRQGVAA